MARRSESPIWFEEKALTLVLKISPDAALTLAWLVALVGSLSVLFIGEILGQTPCNLCWFQRAFMFPLAIILGLGLWWRDRRIGRYAMALAIGGGLLALWHLALYAGVIPEDIKPCSATGPSCTDDNQVILGLPIPLLALGAFASIALLSALSLKENAE
ncbi:MAG: disulfide bond formation protein B [Minwuia sp.]|jgi:disulfide bond formation protein DsbB|uniref:disulfide bond formation protein B n=1 Tax=Minwuia sp. TaxID=2493630 RepID=UPI003A8A4330